MSPKYRIVDLTALPATPCPCGSARRALADVPDAPATLHRTEISCDAKPHYHRQHTEIYYILECEPDAAIELDDEVLPLRAGCCVYIPPGVRHRARGRMTILNVVIPKFDPADEVVLSP